MLYPNLSGRDFLPDVGCLQADLSARWVRRGRKVWGIEPSESCYPSVIEASP
jgi:hypothetical protein